MKKYIGTKLSKDPWIGEIPNNWIEVKLKFLGKAIIGLTYSPEEVTDKKGTLVLRSNNINQGKIVTNQVDKNVYVNKEIKDNLIVQENDLLICSRNGSKNLIGKVGLIKTDQVGSSFGAFTTVFRSPYNQFLYYMFRSPLFQSKIGSYLTSTINQLTTTNLKNMKIVLPSEQERGFIVKFLNKKTTEIDNLISDKEKLIKLLEEKRQAVITEAVTKGIDPNAKMKDSGVEWIGEIPAHWDLKKLKYVYKSDGNGIKIGPFGSSLKLDEMTREGIKVYGQENLIKRDFHLGDKYISNNKFNQLRAYEVKEGDILFSMMGTLGKCEVVPNDAELGIMDSHLLKVSPNEKIIIPEYIPLIIRDSMLSEVQMKLFSKGSIMSGINSTIVKNLMIALPPYREQRLLLDYLNKFKNENSKIIFNLKNVIEKLKEYRQSFIYEAVTGKIDVREMIDEIEQEEVSSS